MKKLELSGKLRRMAWEAVMVNPEGYKAIDRIRTSTKLLDKLEKEFETEKQLTEEQEKAQFTVYLEEKEHSLLKHVLENNIPWRGAVLKQVSELCDKLDSAIDWEPTSSSG